MSDTSSTESEYEGSDFSETESESLTESGSETITESESEIEIEINVEPPRRPPKQTNKKQPPKNPPFLIILQDILKNKPLQSKKGKVQKKSGEAKEIEKKLRDNYKEIKEYRKSTLSLDNLSLQDRVIVSKLPLKIKSDILFKLEKPLGESETDKYYNWVSEVLKVPFGEYRQIPITMQNSVEERKEFIEKIRQDLNKAVYGNEGTKQEIVDFIARKITNENSKGNILALVGNPGIGKCHAVDTPIMMSDGTIKKVQDIQVGEFLMGDDSTPREVLSLATGEDDLFEIKPEQGESYVVNADHILCLKYCGRPSLTKDKKTGNFVVVYFSCSELKKTTRSFKTEEEAKKYRKSLPENEIIEISVKKFLELTPGIQSKFKTYRVGVDFPEQDHTISAYKLGCWLGDKYSKSSKQPTFLAFLQEHNLVNNKHIPWKYKCASREQRMQLLAGILDKDRSARQFSVTKKQEQLIDDIVYLARSLGYGAYKKEVLKKGFKVDILGNNLGDIPLKVKNYRVFSKKKMADPLLNNFSIIPQQRGTYYGFLISDNNRYLLGDFTVTHNTKIARQGIAKALGLPFHQISFGGLNDPTVLTGSDSVYVGSKVGRIAKILQDSKCMNPVIFLDEIDKIGESHKSAEISGILTHLLDEEQNQEFSDLFLGNVKLDLSKALFVVALNNVDLVDPILKNRLKIVHVNDPTLEEKVIIAQKYLVPELNKMLNLNCEFSDSLIRYIITSKTPTESGVRQLKKNIETILQKINTDRVLGVESNKEITHDYVDKVLKQSKIDEKIWHMYI